MSNVYAGKCFCGAVEFELSGVPAAMGYCHCESCRHWSAGPVNAFTLWQPGQLRVVRGQESIGSYHKTPRSHRQWCRICGGHLFTDHPEWKLVDVYAALLPDLPFEPAVHVNYDDTVLRLHDGKPKFRNVPTEMGGSGELIPE